MYEALLLDLDGTLVADDGAVRPRVAEAVRGLVERGVAVMIATGRSESGTLEVLAELGLELPAVVYNGAGMWCPRTERLIEERVLANATVEATLDFARRHELLTVCMPRGSKFANEPLDEVERRGLVGLENLSLVPRAELPTEYLLRISVSSSRWPAPEAFAAELEAFINRPAYLTSFPLNLLANHRDSPLHMVDVQPPCRGKAEALRWLAEQRGIPAGAVVAVGDADNDVPMFRAAGLGVAMAEASGGAAAAADRQIGSCNSDALADLIEELKWAPREG